MTWCKVLERAVIVGAVGLLVAATLPAFFQIINSI